MNYYFNFTTGLIDGLLARTFKENYVIDEMDPAWEAIPSSMAIHVKRTDKKIKRLNFVREDFNNGQATDRSRNRGTITKNVDTYLHEFLMKEDMIPTMGEIKYEYEYSSPFDNKINQVLLLYKWIAGIQSITKSVVTITREDLKQIGMDHKSPLDFKIIFDKLFYFSIVHNSYEDGKWNIKLGGRDLKVSEGPGFINLKIQIPSLLENIKKYHDTLKENKNATNKTISPL